VISIKSPPVLTGIYKSFSSWLEKTLSWIGAFPEKPHIRRVILRILLFFFS